MSFSSELIVASGAVYERKVFFAKFSNVNAGLVGFAQAGGLDNFFADGLGFSKSEPLWPLLGNGESRFQSDAGLHQSALIEEASDERHSVRHATRGRELR
jgi:hypothetical protein